MKFTEKNDLIDLSKTEIIIGIYNITKQLNQPKTNLSELTNFLTN